ncbi:MAG: LLM class flavin-dependent oxidoreductase [Caldilineaceae bacterium]|nr:LLM class flavin-dependent oxidoreductase [Caldilineaceae bacterium]
MGVRVGINTWSRHVTELYPYLDQVIHPFDSLWLPDHVQYNGHYVAEGWTMAVWALARYPDKLVGHAVLCNSFRNPAHLAKMAATAQAFSGGRVVIGIGAGWNEEEYLGYGWPFPRARVRIEQLAEAIQIMRAMWTDTPVNFAGKHYQLENAYCEPKPEIVPPVMVGGGGERYLLRVVAEHADWWNWVYSDVETYAHKQSVLKEHCRAVGREYDEILQMMHVSVLIAENESELQRLREDPEVRPSSEGTIEGTPAQVTDALLRIVEQGAQRITVNIADAPRVEGSYLFAATVLPHLSG